jgi:hypothetical protein
MAQAYSKGGKLGYCMTLSTHAPNTTLLNYNDFNDNEREAKQSRSLRWPRVHRKVRADSAAGKAGSADADETGTWSKQ